MKKVGKHQKYNHTALLKYENEWCYASVFYFLFFLQNDEDKIMVLIHNTTSKVFFISKKQQEKNPLKNTISKGALSVCYNIDDNLHNVIVLKNQSTLFIIEFFPIVTSTVIVVAK